MRGNVDLLWLFWAHCDLASAFALSSHILTLQAMRTCSLLGLREGASGEERSKTCPDKLTAHCALRASETSLRLMLHQPGVASAKTQVALARLLMRNCWTGITELLSDLSGRSVGRGRLELTRVGAVGPGFFRLCTAGSGLCATMRCWFSPSPHCESVCLQAGGVNMCSVTAWRPLLQRQHQQPTLGGLAACWAASAKNPEASLRRCPARWTIAFGAEQPSSLYSSHVCDEVHEHARTFQPVFKVVRIERSRDTEQSYSWPQSFRL